MRRNKWLCLLLGVALLLSGCGGMTRQAETPEPVSEQTADEPVTLAVHRNSDGGFRTPTVTLAQFHPDAAQSSGDVQIDTSATSQGYVAVAARSEHRLKFQTIIGETTYTYNIDNKGTPSIFPLQSGNGSYLFRVMENVVDSKYAELWSVTADVSLEDEYAPFLCNSDYVDYSDDSACVRKAAELAAAEDDALGFVSAVYSFVCEGVRYDREKAATVKSGYLPDPDETMSTGKGICFDYASLAAAMLRSQGIPTKVIFGYVSPNDVYHAWNMFYTEQSGWVTVSYEVSGRNWNRLDLTFVANGADDSFIGDGSNYAEVYFY